jgi:hypothetical protein
MLSSAQIDDLVVTLFHIVQQPCSTSATEVQTRPDLAYLAATKYSDTRAMWSKLQSYDIAHNFYALAPHTQQEANILECPYFCLAHCSTTCSAVLSEHCFGLH